MRRWMWVVPALLLAGCSKPSSTNPSAQVAPDSSQSAVQAGDARGSAKPSPEEPGRADMVIPRGTALHVRIDETVDTKRNRAGDQFRASLAEPVVVDGRTVVPRGTPFLGHVTES